MIRSQAIWADEMGLKTPLQTAIMGFMALCCVSAAGLPATAQSSSYDFYLTHNSISYCLYQEGFYSLDEYVEAMNEFIKDADMGYSQVNNFHKKTTFRSDRRRFIERLGGCGAIGRRWKMIR